MQPELLHRPDFVFGSLGFVDAYSSLDLPNSAEELMESWEIGANDKPRNLHR